MKSLYSKNKKFYDLSSCLINVPHDTSCFVGYNPIVNIDLEHFMSLNEKQSHFKEIVLPDYAIFESYPFLNELEINYLKNVYEMTEKQQLSTYSVQTRFGTENNGIKRSSFYHYDLALYLFSKLNLPLFKTINNKNYIACQFNPLLRFIEYQSSNNLVAHHDTSIIFNETHFSCSTFIIYLTTNTLGQTRFLNEHTKDVIYQIPPQCGKACFFDHNIYHDSNHFEKTIEKEDNKLILTTEIVYTELI